MDILKDKQSKQYNYISRYATFPFYFNTQDKKYIYGLTSHLKEAVSYVLAPVDFTTTLDNLASKYYGRPDYWWVIADFNRIKDPFIPLIEQISKIKIPSISSIEFMR